MPRPTSSPHKGEATWRNLTVSIQRPGRKNNRVTAQIAAKQLNDPIPQAFDVLPTLLRMWNVRGPERTEPDQADDAGGSSPTILPMRRDQA